MESLRLKVLLPLLLLCLSTFILDRQNFLVGPRMLLETVTAPVQFGAYRLKNGLGETFSFLTFWHSGEARIKNLELRVLEMNAGANRVKDLEQQNNELRVQLGVKELSGQRLLPVEVLGISRYLEIAAGKNDGVFEGQSVVYLNNLIGKVVKVSGRVSFVQLARDSDAKIPAKIGLTRGLVVGQFNSGILLTQVASNEDVRSDDLVLTSGEGGTYSPDMVIGKVKEIQNSDEGLFKEAKVSPVIDFGKLTTIFVVLE